MARGRPKKTTARAPKGRLQNGDPLEAAKEALASDSIAQKKDIKEVKKLIDLGKEKGYLTYDEVNDMLPADIVSPDQIDDVMSIFGEMDIEVIDSNQRVTLGGQAEELAEEEEEEKEADVEVEGDIAGKTGDPVRMYLREMGTVSLLSREGEVEIAKKIEEGEKRVIEEVLSSPLALRYVLGLGEQLSRHEIRVREIIEDGDEELDYLENEEVYEKRLLDQIAKLRRLNNEREKIKRQMERKHLSGRKRKALQEALAKQDGKILGSLEALQLNRRQAEAIVDGL
ncbi:RNA polymerase sigma factor RpoD, partial [bacterium]